MHGAVKEISTVRAKKVVDGKEVSDEGHLYYRGHDIRDLVHGFVGDKRFGFEETAYLLLFGHLPNMEELANRGKIIRPAYLPVHEEVSYVPLADR